MAYAVVRGEVLFYKAVAMATSASLVALLHPGDGQRHGPYGLEVWRLEYRARCLCRRGIRRDEGPSRVTPLPIS